LYRESARLYDALLRAKDYKAASDKLHGLLLQHAPDASSLLDVACGTGRHLEYLKEHYRVEGVDLSEEMLEIARKRCPTVPFHQASFLDFSLRGNFDVVTCLFGAIGYATSVHQLEQATARMASHLRPGGVLVIEPWITPERFEAGKLVLDTVDEDDLKIVRTYISRQEGRLSLYDIHFLVATSQGVSHFREQEELGLFSAAEYTGALKKAGLKVRYHDGLFGYGLYIGTL
jgi:SAM-dependent methyltransferase